MDGQEYLNQISADVRPTKSGGRGGFFKSKFFVVGAIGVGLLIVIMIIGALLGNGKTSEKEKILSLKYHLNNTAEILNEYQTKLKSSDLRSSSASLYGVLTNTSKELDEYLETKNSSKDKNSEKKIEEAAELDKDKLSNELFEAKINGLLDRTLAHDMTYEISLFMAEEATILKNAKNDNLKEILNTSHASLENLYNKFNDFSEGQ